MTVSMLVGLKVTPLELRRDIRCDKTRMMGQLGRINVYDKPSDRNSAFNRTFKFETT